MSKALQEKINELFEATKDLRSLEEIKPHCERFNEWVNQQTYSEKSLGTLFSRYGLYSKFRSIPLEQDKNASLVEKKDGEGNVKGHELKHYVPLLCGLNKEDWQTRNQSTRAIDRLENSTELDPSTYLEVTGKLLNSEDPHELAVGIIAATGRRPHEVLARARFEPVEGKPYNVMFSGQGKKRGEKPVFEIATLYPADFVIKSLARLRRESSTKALLKEVTVEFPSSITRQNVAIGSRRNGSLLRVVREYFGDKGDSIPVLKFRHGDEQDNNKALRAAYAVLATERDCQGSFGAKILHASRLLGHFTKKTADDRDLAHIATTAGYSDYFTTKLVPFPAVTEKEKSTSMRVNESDLEAIRELQLKWQLPNQQAVISRLISRHEKTVELGKQLQEFQAKNNQLAQDKREMAQQLEHLHKRISQLEQEKGEVSQVQSQPEQVTDIDMETLEAKIERLIDEKLSKALPNLANAEPSNKLSAHKPATKAPAKEVAVVDWGGMSNVELWTTKVRGASEEKIRRCYEAICLYNDTVATGDSDRLAITNQALRELSGVNGLLVGDWVNAHEDEVLTHNGKYGMLTTDSAGQPKRNKSGTIENYYNKRHGAEKITKILNLVNEQFLDGEALKSRN